MSNSTFETAPNPSLNQTTAVWWKIGILSFGGPAAQISLMHRHVVDENKWLTEQQFLNALSFCMLLPGPEAMQLATYAGWRLHGVLGGLIAGLLFVLPGAAIIMILAGVYASYGDVPLVAALFYGVKAAVLVIVLEALIKVSKKALVQKAHWVIALLAFVGLFFLAVPYPLIVLGAGLYGLFATQKTAIVGHQISTAVSVGSSIVTVITWLVIWLLPLILLSLSGAPEILIQIGQFFSTLAVVTFGGAYAVLAYMAQDVVTQFGWLTPEEMIDALGLAETTPGPLILVTQFVGFLAGFKEGGIWLAISAAGVALWMTFAPCFLWIFTGAPYLEWISNQPRLKNALSAITAAVVGVILNLSIWFALHVLFSDITRLEFGFAQVWLPAVHSIEWLALALFALSSVLVFKLHWNILKVLPTIAILGAILRFGLT
jgi:chromate transporter